jgi:hypothetical protein
MRADTDVETFDYKFHRNGVSSESRLQCKFEMTLDGEGCLKFSRATRWIRESDDLRFQY